MPIEVKLYILYLYCKVWMMCLRDAGMGWGEVSAIWSRAAFGIYYSGHIPCGYQYLFHLSLPW